MKKHIFIITGIILLFTMELVAQSRVATVDINEIMTNLPENQKIKTEIEELSKSLNSRITAKEAQFQEKIKAYNEQYPNLSRQQRVAKEKELNGLEKQLGSLQESANKQISEKQNALLQPLITKVKKAVKAVAQSKKYTHVLNKQEQGLGNVIYSTQADDITPLVKAKLGL